MAIDLIENKLIEIIMMATGRKDFIVEGQNSFLSLWMEWYKGDTAWHTYKGSGGNGKPLYIKRKSSGVAKLIGEDWASNYANENTRITVNNKDNQNVLVQNVLKKNKVLSRFNTFVEMFMCLGIGATVVMPSKIVYNKKSILKSKETNIKITYISADKVYPITIEDGTCIECAFIKYSTNYMIFQIHLLEDGYYWIIEAKGKRVNSGITTNYNFEKKDINILKTSSKIPLFQIWYPNIKDNHNLENPLGASVYADSIDTFKAIDVIFDSFFKEFKNGSKKRFISADLERINAEGQLESFIAEDEEFVIPKGDDGKTLIQEFNGELRVDSHIKAMDFYLNYAAKKCGLGDNRFEFTGAGGRPIQTATGVIAKETALFRNVVKQENFATDRFIEMLMAIAYVNNEYTTNIKLDYTEDDIEIVYDDNIVEDTDSKKKQELSEVQNGVMSLAEYRSHWYDEDYDNALKFLQENAMLINIYLPSLQAGAITPEKFVELVYGPNVKEKNELIAYIEERMSFNNQMFNNDYEEEGDEENQQKESEEKGSDS
ncbi:MAG: hypothetical protein NC087_04430 [Anaeroplasma bactoclasticum]|nr:hypothetical protein [Anaeroplasma bactoclasticum]